MFILLCLHTQLKEQVRERKNLKIRERRIVTKLRELERRQRVGFRAQVEKLALDRKRTKHILPGRNKRKGERCKKWIGKIISLLTGFEGVLSDDFYCLCAARNELIS